MASGIRRSARSASTARTARSPRPSHRITRGVLADPMGAASAPSGPAGRVTPPTFGGDPSAASCAASSPNDAIFPHAAVPPPPPRTHHPRCASSRTRAGAAVSAVAAPSPRGQAALLEGVDPPAGGDATAPAVAAPRPRSRAALPLVAARHVRVAVVTLSLRDRAALPLAVSPNARGGAAAAAGVPSLSRGRAALPPRGAAPNARLGRAGGVHETPPPSCTRTALIDSSAETDEMELYMRASMDTWTGGGPTELVFPSWLRVPTWSRYPSHSWKAPIRIAMSFWRCVRRGLFRSTRTLQRQCCARGWWLSTCLPAPCGVLVSSC